MDPLTGTGTPVFASGLLLGALLLVAGLIVGIWLGRRAGGSLDSEKLDHYHMANMLGGLFKWTDGFAADVSQYRQVVDQVSQQFSEVAEDEASENHTSVLAMLSQIAKANESLQERIDKAESALQEQAEEIASYMSEARTDTLTGLPNRRVLDDELFRRMAEWNRYHSPLALMIVDIDFFKRFNDEHGHLAGDAVLQQVARVLRDTIRESDLVVRMGGEEFAVVLPGSEGQNVWLAAERTRRAVNDAVFHYEGTELAVTISCGAAQAVEKDTLSALVKRADDALYSAKRGGRNCAHWHDGSAITAITPGGGLNVAEVGQEGSGGDFDQVCKDLRQRLLTVVDQDAAEQQLVSDR